jgi:hypothetical protein
MTTLRYSQFQKLTSTTGTPTSQNFAGNSCYDPDKSGTGGQPVNYDDFTLHYLRYRVIASRITVTCHTLSATATGVQNLVLYPYNSSQATSVLEAAAQPYAISSIVHPIPTVVSAFASTEKIVGRNPRTTDALGAQYNADPADIWYWGFIVQTIDGSTTSDAYYQFHVDYDVEFFDRLVTDLDGRLDRLLAIQRLRKAREEQRRAKAEHDSKESGADAWESVQGPEGDPSAKRETECPSVRSSSFAPLVVRLNSRASVDVSKGTVSGLGGSRKI